MKVSVRADVVVEIPKPIPALIQIEPSNIPGSQTVSSPVLMIAPEMTSEILVDIYGNRLRRICAPQGDLWMTYSSEITLKKSEPLQDLGDMPDAAELPQETLIYLLPSRYCESDRLVHMAETEFGDAKSTLEMVERIRRWINEHITYTAGASDTGTSASHTLTDRAGVCRDFAHVAIALCRAMSIPARYCSGYCLGLEPPDFHAYFQAYVGKTWVSFDATQLEPRPALIPIAIGRDAADCAWCTLFGNGTTKSLNVSVTEIAE